MSEACVTQSSLAATLSKVDTKSQIDAFKKIQMYVLITILVLLVQLGHLLRPFAFGFFRLMSWLSYLLVPVLISYILGLMGRPVPGYGMVGYETVGTFRYLTCVWVIFLLFAHAGFDNLNAFSLEERHGRSKLVIQVGIQFSLLLLILHQLPPETNVVPISCAFIVLASKFVGRLLALAHSAGATPRIKKDVTRIINYMKEQANVGGVKEDHVTMPGSTYLVGPKYSKVENSRIVDGITMKMFWTTDGNLLKKNMELKDTCLSFSLFWLLLGKFWSYPLYESKSSSSRLNAWKMVRNGLLAKSGDHERVFRVIEIELAFLRDYFHAKYIFFYLNGFYWKIISIIALPAMFWWFIQKAIDYQELDKLTSQGYGGFEATRIANTIVISVIVALEAMQLFVFLTSRWLKVTLYCLYVKRMSSKNTWPIYRKFIELFGRIFLGKSRSSNTAWWRKPWKRELDQFSLVECSIIVPKPTSYLKLHFISIFGVSLTKPGRKEGKPVALSDQVKKAVVMCLQRNEDASPMLTNGAESLRRNGIMGMLPGWALTFQNDTQTLVVWHVATTVCYLEDIKDKKVDSTEDTDKKKQEDLNDNMKVATDLSNYCAYLLFFAPSLLPVPSLEAETICDTAVEEATGLVNSGFFSCLTAQESIYSKLTEKKDEEAGDSQTTSELITGAKLASHLMKNSVGDKNKRWKILADFWAEMILYLAPSDNNEMAHAGKLSQGGEFITQLWALLIHAGICDRDDVARAFPQPADMHIDQEQHR